MQFVAVAVVVVGTELSILKKMGTARKQEIMGFMVSRSVKLRYSKVFGGFEWTVNWVLICWIGCKIDEEIWGKQRIYELCSC